MSFFSLSKFSREGLKMTCQIISKHRGKLMGVAAIWIYIFHILPSPAFAEAYGMGKIWWYIRNAGFCGVDMFLFLSGLGLAYHLHRHPISDWRSGLHFLKQRFYRIYVVFLPFTLIYALLDRWSIGIILQRLVCLDQFSVNLYNFCWYVCCILLMYLLTPMLFELVKRPAAAAVLTAGYLWLLFALRGILRSDLYAIAVRVPVFVLGLWAAQYSRESRRIGGVGWIVCVAMTMVGFVLSYGLNSRLLQSTLPACNALVNVLLAPGLCMILAALFEVLARWSWSAPVGKLLTFFGGISLELYLMQEWYVRRGKLVLPAQGLVQQVVVFCVMVVLSVALQKLGGLAKLFPKKT